MDQQENLAMAPWSIGKYAKRSATLHLGSEDQMVFNPDTNTTIIADVHILWGQSGGGMIRLRTDLTQTQVAALSDEDYAVVTHQGRQQTFPIGKPLGPFNNHGFNAGGAGDDGAVAFISIRTDTLKRFTENAAASVATLLDRQAGRPAATTSAGGASALHIVLDPHGAANPVAQGDILVVSRHADERDFNAVNWNYRVIQSAETDAASTVVVIDSALDGGAETIGHQYYVDKNVRFTIQRPTFTTTTDNHVDYTTTIPNIIGFPEHKRCLCQVQSAWFYAEDALFNAGILNSFSGWQQTPPLVGVEIQGVAPQNVFSTNVGGARSLLNPQGENTPPQVNNSTMVGYGLLEPIGSNHTKVQPAEGLQDTADNQRVAYGFKSFRSIVDDGTLISSPFGKQIRVRFVNMTSGETLASASINGEATFHDSIQNNPTHLVLRMLFLDDDEIPQR